MKQDSNNWLKSTPLKTGITKGFVAIEIKHLNLIFIDLHIHNTLEGLNQLLLTLI